ncbi:hypothetical protein DS2_02123 [Catenovulum agarivorans DS-2]|uniref:VIT family protein n=1 Tax=Catenovulum agarivorans DS-2 TaxID=1328313 RepID=W7QSE1_9ALTE|nr:VIT family protein [Catenovulum agarivorans]EWH11942.1 hypothetical protein DS2_02123 [Catenovulum agarivorans DS-2]
MTNYIPHEEEHRSHRSGWLRAAVMGANDGIVSTASLIIGVAAAGSSIESIMLAGVAGLVAGALSMAAGEYVSVSSQSDIERADLAIEKQSLEDNYELEVLELAKIYQERGVEFELAKKVARQLMKHDALGAHARDDIGISEISSAQPFSAAAYSATTFSLGAFLPLLMAWLVPLSWLTISVAISSVIFLALLGMLAAYVGGAPIKIGALRVAFWGAIAMGCTAAVGQLFEVVV